MPLRAVAGCGRVRVTPCTHGPRVRSYAESTLAKAIYCDAGRPGRPQLAAHPENLEIFDRSEQAGRQSATSKFPNSKALRMRAPRD